MNKVMRQYLETAIWTSSTDTDEPLDHFYGVEDFSLEARVRAREDLTRFFQRTEEILAVIHDEAEERGLEDFDASLEDMAHDFWLTRNHHGAGFWDKPELYGERAAEQLTLLAQKFGEQNVYVSDKGELELS